MNSVKPMVLGLLITTAAASAVAEGDRAEAQVPAWGGMPMYGGGMPMMQGVPGGQRLGMGMMPGTGPGGATVPGGSEPFPGNRAAGMGMMHPQMMGNHQAMWRHMATMESRLANIEALLRELVDLEKRD